MAVASNDGFISVLGVKYKKRNIVTCSKVEAVEPAGRNHGKVLLLNSVRRQLSPVLEYPVRDTATRDYGSGRAGLPRMDGSYAQVMFNHVILNHMILNHVILNGVVLNDVTMNDVILNALICNDVILNAIGRMLQILWEGFNSI